MIPTISNKENQIRGEYVEQEVLNMLKDYGNVFFYREEWRDLIFQDTSVEVKCAELVVANGKRKDKHKHRIGRFISERHHHKMIIDEGGYYCFNIVFKGSIILTRFLKAKYAQSKNRYLSVATIYHPEAMTLNQFVKEVLRTS